jgi:hypothetical protein
MPFLEEAEVEGRKYQKRGKLYRLRGNLFNLRKSLLEVYQVPSKAKCSYQTIIHVMFTT